MLGIAAAVLFVIAFIINAAGTHVSAIFGVTSLALLGLICLALYVAGIGPAFEGRRRRTRR